MLGPLLPLACSRSLVSRLLSSCSPLVWAPRLFSKAALGHEIDADPELPSDVRRFANEPRGYTTAHRWTLSRSPDERVEKLIFGDLAQVMSKTSVQEHFLANQMNASLSGIPVDEQFSYQTVDAISDIPLLDQRLHENLARLGLDQLTPVQRHAIGIMCIDDLVNLPGASSTLQRVVGKYDLMAAAQTGSGKTLAYLIPLVNRMLRVYPFEAMYALRKNSSCQYPSGLILAPTRELVQQIHSEVMKLCYRTFLRPVCVYGGERPSRQAHQLSLGCHVVVATPGRLLDFMRQGALALNHCRALVVDEADRLLDMGFEEQMREILDSPQFGMPKPVDSERQTCLYSATFSREVTLLARALLRGPRCISLTLTDQGSGTVVPEWGETISHAADSKQQLDRLVRIVPKEINQRFIVVEEDTATAVNKRLLALIRDIIENSAQSEDSSDSAASNSVAYQPRVLVFCNTKREVDTIDATLHRSGLKCASLHGDKSQVHRTRALELFRKGVVNILVASSVASRGLDIPNVTAVMNIGLPRDADDYVHRIGRTGRMGQPGEAITVLNQSLLQNCSHSVLRDVVRIVSSSQGGLDSVPEEIIQLAQGPDRSAAKSFSYRPKQHGQFSSRNRSRQSSSELDQRYR